MKFLLAAVVLTVVGAHAASDIVVKVDKEELSPLLRTFCCGSVQQRCARACTGRDCTLRCQGYCGIFNSRCGPYTCSLRRCNNCCFRRCNNCCLRRCNNCCLRRCNNCCLRRCDNCWPEIGQLLLRKTLYGYI